MKAKEKSLKVKDLMVRNPVRVDPEATLREAAAKMREADCGVLPVGKKDDVLGIITDRDIVVRAIAKGKDPAKERVSDYMTEDVYSCYESDSLEEAIKGMYAHKVGRLVVRDKEEKMTGILSVGSVIKKDVAPDEMIKIVSEAACAKAA